jgi:hypothetical protein
VVCFIWNFLIRPDLDLQDYKTASPLIDAVGVAERTLDNGSASTPRAQAVQDALVAEHMTAPTQQIKWEERRKISQKTVLRTRIQMNLDLYEPGTLILVSGSVVEPEPSRAESRGAEIKLPPGAGAAIRIAAPAPFYYHRLE